MKKQFIQRNFNRIIELVDSGLNIPEALKIINVSGPTFYKHISQKQRVILGQSKTSSSLYSKHHIDHRNVINKSSNE